MQGQRPHNLKKESTPSCKSTFWRMGKCASIFKSGLIGLFTSTALSPAYATVHATMPDLGQMFTQYSNSHMALMAIFTGGMSFAFLMTILLIKKRILISRENDRLKMSLHNLKKRVELADILIQTPEQISILWPRDEGRPEIYGDFSQFEAEDINQNSLVAFGKWLKAESAKSIDDAVKTLREKAKPFEIKIESKSGNIYSANGYPYAGRSILHLKALTQKQQEIAALYETHAELKTQYEALRRSFDKINMPIWQRNELGALVWVNHAYIKAVNASSRNDVISQNMTLINESDEAACLNNAKDIFHTQFEGKTTSYNVEVVELKNQSGNIFIARDVTEQQSFNTTLERRSENHAEILNQLTSSIAIFDSNQNLKFFNAAFCKLWDLDPSDLRGEPNNSAVLNLLRAQDKLEPQPDWVKWKNDLLQTYNSQSPTEDIWHLPDNRILKVIISPNRNGGVSWIFEDQSERISLESEFKSLSKVQRESFNSLKESICVFGLDGRLKLHNPAFAKLWKFEPSELNEQPHISKIIEHCKFHTSGQDPDGNNADKHWNDLYAAVTSYKDQRKTREGKISLIDDSHYHYALVPLPNGQAMLTFVDVTDSMRVQKVLTERNEALEAADRLKDTFIQHVSYELRTPLTHIIGFSDMLQNPAIGTLNPKQSEYLNDIKNSSSSLLSIVNDILDLVTVDAGVMAIEPQPINFEEMVYETLESVNERLEHHAYALEIFDECKNAPLNADKVRLKQVLVHLINNAIQYSPQECEIQVALANANDYHCLTVSDNGPGIPDELRETIFQRFESQTLSQGRGGAGLGLTIVKSLVELHGGYVDIEHLGHDGGSGTTVNCYFPKSALILDEAAE